MGAAAPFVGMGMQGIQAITSGASGKQAARQAQGRADHAQGNIDQMMGAGMDMWGQQNAQSQQFLQGRGNAQVNGMAQRAYGQIDGLTPQRAQQFQQFSFDPVTQLRGQAMSDFDQFAGNQRAAAAEQAGQAFRGVGSTLNQQMASRGIGAGSGVAAGALSGFAGQQGQTLANLNRDLAAQGNQAGLQAMQFDVGSGLQQAGMQSQYNLAQNQFGLQANDQFFNQGMAAATTPVQMQQQLYQQNQLNPYLQMQAGLNPASMLGPALQGNMGLLDLSHQQNQAASSGKGSAMGGMMGGLGQLPTPNKGGPAAAGQGFQYQGMPTSYGAGGTPGPRTR